MRLWLFRESSGMYGLSAMQPIEATPRGGEPTFYIRPGDPMAIRHLCPLSVKHLFNVNLEILQIIKVRLDGSLVNGVNPIEDKEPKAGKDV